MLQNFDLIEIKLQPNCAIFKCFNAFVFIV